MTRDDHIMTANCTCTKAEADKEILSFIEEWLPDFKRLEEDPEVSSQEYINNILEQYNDHNIDSTSIFYIASRLVLADENCSDDNDDAHTVLGFMKSALLTIIAVDYDL